MAIENITSAMSESKIFQNTGLGMNREAARAPNPMVVNHNKLASEAPKAKNQQLSSN